MEAKRQRLKSDESVIASGSVSRPTRTFKSTFPMQRLQPGLKALISSSSEPEEEKALHRRNFLCLTRTNIFPSWSSSSSEMAEKEEAAAAEAEAEAEAEAAAEVVVEEEKYMSRRQKWRNEWRRRDLPPPLPVVVKKENSELVPWVLKKYSYGGSGNDEGGVGGGGGQRVVIIEERVKHQEYFRVHRANGHLTLQLICVDDDDDDGDDVSPTLSSSKNVEEDETLGLETDSVVLEGDALDVETEDAEEVEEEEHDMNEDKKGDTSRMVEEVPVPAVASSMPELALGSKSNGGGAGAKCWTVSSSVGRISNSDLFRMPIPTIRPIHG